jgi:hypothetical protein
MTLVIRFAETVSVFKEEGVEAVGATAVTFGDAVCPKRVPNESKIGIVPTTIKRMSLVQFI